MDLLHIYERINQLIKGKEVDEILELKWTPVHGSEIEHLKEARVGHGRIE